MRRKKARKLVWAMPLGRSFPTREAATLAALAVGDLWKCNECGKVGRPHSFIQQRSRMDSRLGLFHLTRKCRECKGEKRRQLVRCPYCRRSLWGT